ncbi:MAG: hypothetical protein ACKOAH_29785, partial [Pirellula sp.]
MLPRKAADNGGASDRHPIDAFLDAKIQVALQHMSKKDDELDQQRQASVGLYREKIQPLLAQRCGRCHLDGLQGGLSLADLQGML